jgi:feruloyl esterase
MDLSFRSIARHRGLLAASLLSGATASAQVPYHVETLDFPGADAAAVRLKISAPTAAQVLRVLVTLNGQNISSLFTPDGGDASMTATVSRLVPGRNVVELFESKSMRTPRSALNIEVVDQARCNAAQLGSSIAPALIGEPVSGITLAAPTWTAATSTTPAFCRVNGSMAPVDPAAPPINFAVVLPSRWAYRAVQVGGSGMNGSIPALNGGGGSGASFIARGWVVSGSDSGHSTANNEWSLNDEAMKNLGYMQMKKTHDAAWVLLQRMYGALPRYSYWFGGSQGGREGLTVAQRYPNDYDGVVITVPIVNYSSLMLSRAIHRIQEAPLANWVTTAKTAAISAYVVRQCDALDGLNDGIINNYIACRALFDVNQGAPGRQPWAGLRCPGGVDPNPSNTGVTACLTDGQISTMQFVQTKYFFATPLAFGNRSFGMWVPSTDPSMNGLMVTTRYRGQEGAAANAPLYSWLGGPGVLGFLFKDLGANALDYVEGGVLNDRRVAISAYLDATDPDLSPFFARGGKLISTVGTRDSLASSGSQLDYYQSVHDRLGRAAVDASARLFVLPHTDHGLGGNNHNLDGNGNTIPTSAIPNSFDRVTMVIDWVEKGIAPPLHGVATSATRSLPVCSYPAYPRYLGAALPVNQASSYTCATE